ncbi:hypothetical protein DFH05DRAFT_1501226 [Lentinula detonsa]|uniref:RNI-like protein n=1 Tax=Lentinula detonsa TaxID=2804962 RepID=A0A9W8TVU5_9AGAR|nr:hypothetical protein DFH05DRAFT_1501226 [Lentinula detonsa]
MNTITSELPPRPIVDTQNPLYCPAESASDYLQSIKTGGGIRKLNKKGKLTNLLGKKGKKITVSSFSKMLAKAAVAMRKERENHSGRKELALSLSQISSNDSHDYGTPERRPIRKTRKDRAAQSPVKEKLLTSSPQHNISPTFYSICVSLPKIPIDDLLSESPTSTISLPFTDASADSCITDSISPSVPLAPPGLNLQTKHEPPHESDIGQQQPKSSACVHQTKNETFIPEKKKKRSLEEAFPELLKKPSMFNRSIPVDLQPETCCNDQFTPNHLSNRSLKLDQEDFKCIERGRNIIHSIAHSPDPEILKDEALGADLKVKKNIGSDSAQMKRRLQDLEESVYGPRIGTETPGGYQILVNKLDEMMPGIRLGNRLAKLGQDGTTGVVGSYSSYRYGLMHKAKDGPHQAAADLLAAEGLLNERIINVFRTSEVTRLDLGPSLSEEGGLNLGGRAVWNVFTRPHSFLFLSELSFSNTPVLDMDLVKLVGLPRLAVLILKNTGICDEGVFHLTALKLTLTHLDLSQNPCITDDAIPALCLCITSKLRFLGLVGTSIGMPGLRRMAKLIQKEERIVDVEIPEVCELYIDNIPNIYLMQPQPPLITSPALCSRLSAAALQRNLEAHAEVANKLQSTGGAEAVSANMFGGGTKGEMCRRLRDLLVQREVDLVVWGMIYGYEEADGVTWTGQNDKVKYLEAQAAAREAHKRLR